MPSTFAHRTAVREEFYDFDAAVPSTFPANFQGSFPTSVGPVADDGSPLTPAGDIENPFWFVTYDLPQTDIAESYGDGTVARNYDMPVSIWTIPSMLEVIFELAGAELETYFAAQPITDYVFRTGQMAVQPGVASVGGWSGRTFNIPVMAS